MDTPETDQPATPMAPPTDTDAPEAKPPSWPTVIGVIAIVFGSLGIFQGCAGLASPFITRMALSNPDALPPQSRAQLEVTQQFVLYNSISAIFVLGLAVVLLIAGIGLVRRRAWGRTAILCWAGGKIIYSIPAALLGYVIMRATLAAMKEAGGGALTGFMGFLAKLGAAGLACSIIWTWALPVFCIIWMVRAPVKTEVERWTLESRVAI